MTLNWTTDKPTEIGEYLVETEGMSPIKLKHRILAYWNGNSWNFTGQIFLRRLNIPNIHNNPTLNISIDDIIAKADNYSSDFINPIGNENDHFIAGYQQALIDLKYLLYEKK